MATIKYWFVDGTNMDVEVEEGFAWMYEKIAHRQHLVDRKETRRHQSLNKSMENGFEVADKTNVEQEVMLRADLRGLSKAISSLNSEQRELIYKVYFTDSKQCDIAQSLGVSDSCIWHRLHRMLVSRVEMSPSRF